MSRSPSAASRRVTGAARAFGGSLAFLAVFVPARALGAITSAIEWEAPESCPDAQALYARLSTLLDHDLSALGSARVRGVVVGAEAGLRLTLEVVDSGRRSSRVLVADDCSDLFEAAALAIALAVHGESAGAEPPGAVMPEAGAMQGPFADASSMGEGAEVQRAMLEAAPSLSWSAGAEAVIDFGALPALAPGLALDARAHWRSYSLGVYASLLPEQRLVVRGGNYIDFGLMVAGLRACRALLGGASSLDACLGFEVGRFTAFGPQLDASRQIEDLWLAPAGAVEFRQSIWGPLGLRVRSEALLPLLRKQYAVNETDAVHAPSGVDVRLFAGVVLAGH
jgi:hypothetical protein